MLYVRTMPDEFRSTEKVKVSPSPPDTRGTDKKAGSFHIFHEHAPEPIVRVMRTVNWPPAFGTSMVGPGEDEYAHAPSWVTGKVKLPIGHETVIVPFRGVPEGFASTRYWSADGIPYPGLGGFRIVIQSAFDVACQLHPPLDKLERSWI